MRFRFSPGQLIKHKNHEIYCLVLNFPQNQKNSSYDHYKYFCLLTDMGGRDMTSYSGSTGLAGRAFFDEYYDLFEGKRS